MIGTGENIHKMNKIDILSTIAMIMYWSFTSTIEKILIQ